MLRRLDENLETGWESLIDHRPHIFLFPAGDQERLYGDPQPWDHERGKQGLLVRPLLREHLLVQG